MVSVENLAVLAAGVDPVDFSFSAIFFSIVSDKFFFVASKSCWVALTRFRNSAAQSAAVFEPFRYCL